MDKVELRNPHVTKQHRSVLHPPEITDVFLVPGARGRGRGGSAWPRAEAPGARPPHRRVGAGLLLHGECYPARGAQGRCYRAVVAECALIIQECAPATCAVIAPSQLAYRAVTTMLQQDTAPRMSHLRLMSCTPKEQSHAPPSKATFSLMRYRPEKPS